MIGLPFVYAIAGATFLGFAILSAVDRRFGHAGFYALIALSFVAGDRIGDLANGVLVIALIGIAGFGLMRRGDRGAASPERPRGLGLLVPALIIPAVALIGTLAAKQVPWLVDPKQATLVSLTAGVLIALAVAMLWLRPRLTVPIDEGRRLMDDIGWAAVLPQMLASLGAVFALSGVGTVIGGLAGRAIPADSRLGAVTAYVLGMAFFTMVMGNAFAAFPVMATAIGIPLLIHAYHGDPALVASLGMLAGFCGTLMTPMAANFNLVPAALLDLKDANGVIKAQIPTALPLLGFNLLLLYVMMMR